MGLLSFLQLANSPSVMVASGQQAAKVFEMRKEELEAERQEKLKRQADLWGILTPSTDLETEYKQVSIAIAEIILKQQAIEEQLQKLKIGIFYCEKNGQCQRLQETLQAGGSVERVHYELPTISYHQDPQKPA